MTRLPRSRRAPIALGAAIALDGDHCCPPSPPRPNRSACAQSGPAAPMQVTADCLDPLYAQPVIDTETDETSPVAASPRLGAFRGHQHPVQHLPARRAGQGGVGRAVLPVHLPDRVHARSRTPPGLTTAPSGSRSPAAGTPCRRATNPSPSDTGTPLPPQNSPRRWPPNYYGSDRPIFGYLYGPSGGSFQTVGAAENTDGVWQGFVPMVQAVPQPTSYNFQRPVRRGAHPRRQGGPDPGRPAARRQW